MAQPRPCPICQSGRDEPFYGYRYHGLHVTVVICTECGLARNEPMPMPEELLTGYHRFMDGRYRAESGRWRSLPREGQAPETMVIACCDSRAAPETIFDCGPGELFVSLLSVPLLLVALALLSRPVVVPSWPRKSRRTSLAIGILVFFALIQATIFFPSITRRIGPWHELRARLVQKSQEIDEARARFGIAESVKLTPEQIAQIEAAVFPTPEEFVFPVINRRVILKLMTYRRPYVGVRYGTGSRGVIFDLDTMLAIYAD